MKLMIEQNRKNLMSYSMNLQTLLIANVQNICFIVLKKGTISSITHRYKSTTQRVSAVAISLNNKKYIFHQRKHRSILLWGVMQGEQNMHMFKVRIKLNSLVTNNLIDNKKQETFLWFTLKKISTHNIIVSMFLRDK